MPVLPPHDLVEECLKKDVRIPPVYDEGAGPRVWKRRLRAGLAE
jgi:hypothetical protein